MVTKRDLEKMSDGQIFDTVLMIKSYESKPTKNGGQYLDGLVEMKGSVPFKVWAGDLYDEMDKCEYAGQICQVKGKVNEYNGSKSLILTSVRALEDGLYDASDFFEEKYNAVAYWEALDQLVKKSSTEAGYQVFRLMIEDVKDRFLVEFAARGHHDAVRSGLLAHTYKNVFILTRFMKIYPTIMAKVDVDVLVVGMALHDIGKVHEYTNGAIQGNGTLVSHHTFGVEMAVGYKDKIVDLKGEEFYYRLLSIIEQHHGEFEETPRTVEAFLLHLVDTLEAKFQAIDESLAKELGVVNIDNFKLR